MIDLEDILRKLNTVERRVTHLEQLEHGASDRGAQGEQGEAGPAGPAGPQGEPGEACCDICLARYTTNAEESVKSAEWVVLNFEDEDVDTHDAVTVGAAWKFEPPFDGPFHISTTVRFDTTAWTAAQYCILGIFVNGALYSAIDMKYASEAQSMAMLVHGDDTLYLETTDDVDIRIYQNTGNVIVVYGSGTYSHVAIYGVDCVECP